MTTEANNGGPAFPSQTDESYWHGMSLRDWFAGKALAGVITTCADDSWWLQGQRSLYEHFAIEAYQVADAMLAAREARHD